MATAQAGDTLFLATGPKAGAVPSPALGQTFVPKSVTMATAQVGDTLFLVTGSKVGAMAAKNPGLPIGHGAFRNRLSNS